MNLLRTLPLLLIFCMIWGCSALRPDRLSVEQHLAQADALQAKRDYAGAAEELAKVIRQRPTDGSLFLRRGELLEAAKAPAQAEKAYRRGLAALAAGAPERTELNYRLLQVLTLKLGTPEQAKPLLSSLPAGSIEYGDARGCLAYGEGRYREALQLFEQAEQQAQDLDLKARILYHVSLTYHRLGDDDHAMLALFNAINQAQSLGVRKDIEYFFYDLRGQTP